MEADSGQFYYLLHGPRGFLTRIFQSDPESNFQWRGRALNPIFEILIIIFMYSNEYMKWKTLLKHRLCIRLKRSRNADEERIGTRGKKMQRKINNVSYTTLIYRTFFFISIRLPIKSFCFRRTEPTSLRDTIARVSEGNYLFKV